MSKKIILNDNEVVFNEDVEAAQNWRQRDFNRVLEAMWRGTFGQGPLIAGTVVGAAIVSGLDLIKSATNLTVLITPGTALFGFGGTDTAFDNIYQLATSEATVTLALNVAHPTLYRWDIIEVSAEKIVTTETRKVLTALGPTRRLVDTVVPKVEENRLKFRVRPSDSYLAPLLAKMQPLQPDPAWLPLFAIFIPPAALTAAPSVQHDLRLWLRNFDTTNFASQAMNGWRSPPSLFKDDPGSGGGNRVLTPQNAVTISGYTAPVGFNSLGTNPTRLGININVERPTGLTYVVDRWYYLYAVRPHLNCGFVALTLSDLAPPVNTGIPNGTRIGLPLPPPWPAEPTAPGYYLGAIRLFDAGGGNFNIHDFVKAGNYVSFPGYQEPLNPPGAAATSRFLLELAASGLSTRTINPGTDGPDVVPPHVCLVKTLWYVETNVSDVTLTVFTQNGFVIIIQRVKANDTGYFTVDIPLPFDGSTQYQFRINGGTATVEANILGYYEDLP